MITRVEWIILIIKLNLRLQCGGQGLCDYSEAYIFIKGTIIITRAENYNAGIRLDGRRKGVIIKIFSPFKECIGEINNTQIDNAKYRDVVMPMYNLIEYIDNYSRTSGRLW